MPKKDKSNQQILDLDKKIKELIKNRGDKVDINTDKCFLWKLNHGSSNCNSCPSGVGCHKLLKIKFAFLATAIYESKSLNDFREMNQQVDEYVERILQACTTEELKEIPDLQVAFFHSYLFPSVE